MSKPFENQAFEKQTKQGSAIPALRDMNTLQLPFGLDTVEAEAFYGLNCEAVIIPIGCTTIQSKAFAECKNLIYVFVPQTVANISKEAFDGCENVIVDIQK